MKNILFLLILIGFCDFSIAQGSDELIHYKKKYPLHTEVETSYNKVVTVSVKKENVLIEEKYNSKRFYLDQPQVRQVKESLHFSSFRTIEDIVASTENYVNGKYKEVKVKDFTEKDEMGTSFYDDQKSINFYYSKISSGSKTNLSYSTIVNDPRFIGSFFMGNYYPIENYNVKFIVSNDVSMKFILKNFDDNVNYNYSETKKGSSTIYEWSMHDIKSVEPKNNSVEFRYLIPHVIPVVESYVTEGETVNVLKSTKDLYRWYKSLTAEINRDPCDKNLTALVDSLVGSCETDLEKVTEIYNWTQKNIKYVAFEDGFGGFIPREANDVYNKKYGDCKDNSSLMKQMLNEADLKGYLTWIGTRSLPYTYDGVHSPVVDNHMIMTYFDEDDKPYFLDATGRYLDINLPSSFIQGKEALVEVDNDNYRIIKVPIVDNSNNLIADVVEISIVDGVLNGSGTREYDGFEKMRIFNSLERIETNEKLNEFYDAVFEIGNNSFELESFEEFEKFEYGKKFNVDYKFNLRNQLTQIGDEIFINMNLNQGLVQALKSSEPIENPVDYPHQYFRKYHTELIIPKGYDVLNFPENYSVDNKLCTVEISYKIIDDKLIYDHEVRTKFLILSIDQQIEFQEIIKTVLKEYKETVQLKLN